MNFKQTIKYMTEFGHPGAFNIHSLFQHQNPKILLKISHAWQPKLHFTAFTHSRETKWLMKGVAEAFCRASGKVPM